MFCVRFLSPEASDLIYDPQKAILIVNDGRLLNKLYSSGFLHAVNRI